MRILHVINTLKTGGAEKLVSEIVPKLRDLGNHVDVFVFDNTESAFKHSLQIAGINVIGDDMGCNVYNPKFIWKLIGIMRNYDIVHTHNTSPQLFAAVASVISNTTLVTTEHSTSNRRRGSKAFLLLDKFMYGKYRKVICISDKTNDFLKEYIPSLSGKLITIYNGVDVNRFLHARPSEDLTSEKFIVCMVAGFRYQKDHETAIKALSALDKTKFEFWFVGDGDRRQIIENTIKKLHLENSIRLLGIRNDIPSVIKSADIVLQSSHIEGFGLAAVEGMAAGKPVLASDVPGLSEVVGGAGVLFPHGDYRSLADNINKLFSNQEYYHNIARQCKERAMKYDINRMVENYNSLYMTLTT